MPFVVLTDLNGQLAKAFGLVFEMDEGTAKRDEEKFGICRRNGDAAGGKLPLAATQGIMSEGRIANAFLVAARKKPAEPAEVLGCRTGSRGGVGGREVWRECHGPGVSGGGYLGLDIRVS